MEFRVIIPARYAAERLPGKALEKIAGKPMIQHVYERALESGAESVVIATDDERIQAAAEAFGAKVVMTSEEHASGTERLSEAVEALEYDEDEIVVCVQGDEPLIDPSLIRQVAEDLDEHDNVKVTSLCEEITKPEELFDPHAVKVVMNRRHHAIYFSRAPIPWNAETFSDPKKVKLTGRHFRHIGIYAYRVSFLQDYINWSPSPLEEMEKLEQLRILWNGGRIHMAVSKKSTLPGVDTQDDLDRMREYFKQR